MAVIKQEKKDLVRGKSELEKTLKQCNEKLEEALMAIKQLEKDIALQEEVLKKRHAEISNLLKENTSCKNEIDDLNRTYGLMQDLDERTKIATLKEQNINTLLSKLDHVMVTILCHMCSNQLKTI